MNEHDPAPDDLALLRQLRQLPRERTPPRDLWPAIAARVAPAAAASPRARRRLPLWSGLALAASLGAVALLATRQAPPVPDAALAVAPAAAVLSPAGAAMRHEADALTLEYRLALQPFEDAPLPPALRAAAIELDASAAQLRGALREQPQAPYLLDRLRHTYDQRLKLAQRGALG
jgi:hypothetical protein